ncbi:hypothetical protein DSL72_003005 [Monilinia vaccinii-corymbosi]|uniref:Uncharacterized protein n=1 Tax=Monilinia vaccinii-corymbosi TaxID=61207 RepID=A0A8A3P525_9HELO|nr:hypothetical protein DSL72_003005 [Monilinia vaccinii-corymbosi]
MQNCYSPITDDQKDGWPLKLHRLGRELLGRKPSQRATPILYERPILIAETPESDLVDILSSTINTTASADFSARSTHKRQNTLEDPKRFNVLDAKNNDRNPGVIGTLKRAITDKPTLRRPDSSLATREPPVTQGSLIDLASNSLAEDSNTRPVTPKPKIKAQSSSPARTARYFGRKLSLNFSKKWKGVKLDSDAYTAYPSDIKIVVTSPPPQHTAFVDEVSTSTSPPLSTQSKPLRRKFSFKNLHRTITSSSQKRPPVPPKDPMTIRKVVSSFGLRDNEKIVTELPAGDAKEIMPPPPIHTAFVELPTHTAFVELPTQEEPRVYLSEHPVPASTGCGADISSLSRDSQLQSHITDILHFKVLIPASASAPAPASVPDLSLSRAGSNSRTARSSIDLYGTTNMTTQYTHDTVSPLIIRKANGNEGSSPTRFTTLKRSLSDFKSSRPTPSRSQSQDTGVPSLSPKPKRTESTRPRSYYTLGSLEPAIPGLSRSRTVSNAKRNSALSLLSQRSSASTTFTFANPRDSILSTIGAPRELDFLPLDASSAASASAWRHSSGPDSMMSAHVPRRVRTSDFIKMFEVPNLMMDCGGFDEQDYSASMYSASMYSASTCSDVAPDSPGLTGREVEGAGLDGETAEFERFIADARDEDRMGMGMGMGMNMGMGARGVTA